VTTVQPFNNAKPPSQRLNKQSMRPSTYRWLNEPFENWISFFFLKMVHSLLVILQKDEKGRTSQIAANFCLKADSLLKRSDTSQIRDKRQFVYYCLDAARLLLRSISMSWIRSASSTTCSNTNPGHNLYYKGRNK
jgi:hypothetical protein